MGDGSGSEGAMTKLEDAKTIMAMLRELSAITTASTELLRRVVRAEGNEPYTQTILEGILAVRDHDAVVNFPDMDVIEAYLNYARIVRSKTIGEIGR